MSDEAVPKEFNDANIRAAREYKARAEAAEVEIERLRKENTNLRTTLLKAAAILTRLTPPTD